MTTARELRGAITSNRQALRDALDAAADRWESGDDGGWSPRLIAEHCVGREFGLAGIATAATQGQPADERYTLTNHSDSAEFSFGTAADALAALEATGAACDHVFRGVDDQDLEKPAELDAGSLPKNIEGVMQLAAWHLNDHTEQILKT